MIFIPILNKTSPWAQTKSELDVLGVPGKLVKYVVHSSKRKIQITFKLVFIINNQSILYYSKKHIYLKIFLMYNFQKHSYKHV
jgi:hypothetical protein